MSRPSRLPSLSQINDTLSYCPETGIFKWKVNRGGKAIAGETAGTLSPSGYIKINILGKICRAHRLAWYVFYGEEPQGFIDHKDCDKKNNRIENLRIATKPENMCNRPAQRNSRTGVKGVSLCKSTGRYVAQIMYKNNRVWLGRFDSIELASEAYNKKAKELHGEFAQGGKCGV